MPAAPRLPRRLSAFDATTLVISNMIGTGIFFTTGWVAASVPSGPGILAAWLVGGVFSMCGALSYAELGAAFPRAGGEYVYLREAYGPLLGFLSGWTSLFIGFAAPVAIGMLGFSAYLAALHPALGSDRVLLAVPGVRLTGASVLALAVLAALVGAQFLGRGADRRVHVAVTVAKLVAIAALIAVALASGGGRWTHLASAATDASWTATAFVAAIVPITFSYSGWNAAAYVAEEMEAPERNLPLALVAGTGIVTAVYLVLNAVYLYALPAGALAGVDAVAAKAVGALLGARGGALVSAVIALSILGAANAMLLVGARVLYAMAQDGVFFRFAGRVDPRTGIPGGGVLGIAGVAAAMVLLGDLRSLLEFAGFTLVVFGLLAVTSVFVLRRTRPDLPRPYRVWGYPVVPAVFVALSLYLVYASFVFNLRATAAGVGLVALGVPAYRLLRVTVSPRARDSAPPS
jgi:APA family basic amino acid/polyamine antiporter